MSADSPTVSSSLTLRRLLLGAILVLLVQAGVGMVVNLDVNVPADHPGARPSNYLAGSLHDTSSLIMALLCFAAIAAYTIGLAREPGALSASTGT